MTSFYKTFELNITEVEGTTFTITKADKTITCTATGCSSVYWTFGDGSQGVGTETSHTYTAYNTYAIMINYLAVGANGKRVSTVRRVKIDGSSGSDDELMSNVKSDVFSAKPIIIPADCTGNISVTALVEDLATPANITKSIASSSVSANVTFVGSDTETGIAISGNTTIDIEIDYTTTTSSSVGTGIDISDCKLENLEFIPAFYDNGYITIAQTFKSTDSDDSELDVTFDLKMMVETAPDWYETNLSYDSQIFKNLITSERNESKYPDIAEYTVPKEYSWKIAGFGQMPPFEIKEWIDPATIDDDNTTGVMSKRACLANPKFKISITNNNSSTVYLSNIDVMFTWNFNPSGLFMTMRTEGNRRGKFSDMYTLPKGAEKTRLESLGFPIYAVVDGYTFDEIVKVFATWNEYYETGDYYFPTTIELQPVESMSGPDYPTCLYKCDTYPLKRADFIRITDGDWISEDGVVVLDAPMIAASDHYRTINIKVQSPSGLDGYNPDANDATFVIETMPNESVDDPITQTELEDNVSKIHFFNVTKDFVTNISIPRSEIEPTYYETLWQTYNTAVTLESVVEEPLYFVNFTVNDYPVAIPIRNGQTISFSDSLSHAADGIRSGDVWLMDGVTPNIINIQCPTKHKYKVKFKVDYEVYKHMYVIGDDDIPSGYL